MQKKFCTSDYCNALQFYPKCNYFNMREVIIFPSKCKLQSITKSADIKSILCKTFDEITEQQKECFLIIDEVKIRPQITFAGGFLSGMSKDNPNMKATAMLAVMLRSLHGGPSIMLSVVPVSKLTAEFQFEIVKQCTKEVEDAGGKVIGSITDNHKINQQYCKLFSLQENWRACHPLDSSRVWFLLYDTVHLLKCIRNNWLTEPTCRLSIGGHVGNFSDVRSIYNDEKKAF